MKTKYTRNKDGYYRETWVVGKKLNGKQDRITVRDKNYNLFLKKVDEAKRLYKKGVSTDNITVAEWCDRWLVTYKTNASNDLKSHFAAKVRLDIVPVIGHMQIKDVRASHLVKLLNESKKAKGTVIKIRIAIRQIFDCAEMEGIIEMNPAKKLNLPENLDEEPRRPLTDFECKTVFNVAQVHKHGAYVLTMILCGLRRGECVALKVENVDFAKKRLSVQKAVRFRSNQGSLKQPKSEAGVRETPIPDILIPFLEKQCLGKNPEDHVFTKVDGSRATGTTVREWWDSFKRQCHISAGAKMYRNKILIETSPFADEITPHYLRHTYATDIHAAGVHEREQKFFMGHKSYDVTDGYRAISDESFTRAAEQINDYFTIKNKPRGQNGDTLFDR